LAEEAGRLLKFKKGTQWTYARDGMPDETMTVTGGSEFRLFVEWRTRRAESPEAKVRDVAVPLEWTVRFGDVVCFDDADPSTSPGLQVRLGAQPGDTWYANGFLFGGNLTASRMKPTYVRVPAGEFKEAMRIHYEYPWGSDGGTVEDLYFAPDVGLIKAEWIIGGALRDRLELKEFKPVQ
jgi:hypothetical protein